MTNVETTITTESVDEFLGMPGSGQQSKLKRWALATALAALLLLILSLVLDGNATAPEYATVELKRGDMTVHVTATGNLEPTNEVSVGSELSGILDEVFVDINDKVVKDQPLAQIDPEKLNDAILRSAAALEQARASVLQADATVEQTRASLARFEEVHRLSSGKVPSLAELDTARAESKRAVANLAAARASVSSAEAQLSTDRTNLAKATVRSPVDGVILSRQVEPGQTVAASFNTPTLFVIAEDLAAMKLEVKVDEADVGQVAVGQPTSFTVDAYPGKTFEAVITRVNVGSNTEGAATAATSTSNVISYGAILSVENKNLALRPGMTATASILTSQEQDVFIVPNAALRFQPATESETSGGISIFGSGRDSAAQEVTIGRGARQNLTVLGADGALSEVPVVVGSTDGAWTIVTGDSLLPGMQIVTGAMAPVQ
ncbi:MAG: efflux RND transporter periplasmic adaptor subunit [Halioglobus sp.]|nr:efflux RND transporter periplasmic adaptor subunit [Halioglobus sp.]